MSQGPIAWARQDLARTLAGVTTLPVLTSPPERLEPPCVVITEGSPLLAPDETTHGAVTVALDAVVIMAPSDAPLALARLDEHTDTIATSLLQAGTLPTVEAYTTITSADGQPYLSAAIHTTHHLTIDKD